MEDEKMTADELEYEIGDRLGDYGVTVRESQAKRRNETEYDVELETESSAGEDWVVPLTCGPTWESFCKALEGYATDFDVDEEVALWAPEAGKNGVPDTRTLVEDAEWKQEELRHIAAVARYGTDPAEDARNRPRLTLADALELIDDETVVKIFADNSAGTEQPIYHGTQLDAPAMLASLVVMRGDWNVGMMRVTEYAELELRIWNCAQSC